MSKKQTLELSLEEAIKYYNSSNDEGFKNLLEDKFGKDFHKPKDITSKVFNLSTLMDHFKNDLFEKFNLPYPDSKNKFEKYLNACYILTKVAEVYNNGTVLDWKNTKQYKYLPYKYYSSCGFVVAPASGWRYSCEASGCLYYKSSELSTISYNNFKDYWEDYWGIDN